MKWLHPYYQVKRFGFEISMFIYMKPDSELMEAVQQQLVSTDSIMKHACMLPVYTRPWFQSKKV